MKKEQREVYNPFRGMGKAKASKSGGGGYILDGEHLLQIKELKVVTSQKTNDEFFCAEFVIVMSDNEEMVEGRRVSWMCNFKQKLALSNIKAFLVAAFNCDEDEIDEDVSNAVTQVAQPLRDYIVKCNAYPIKVGPKKDRDFTKCDWEHGMTAEEAEDEEQDEAA